MENQTFGEWINSNPGKNINDYYAIYGKPSALNNNANQSINHQNTIPPVYSSSVSSIINIRIAPWRIFVYTGIVMGSAILWTIIYFTIIYGIAGHFLKDVLLKLSGSN